MQVKMHAANSQLSKLVEAAENGEDVVLARGDVPARIVSIRPVSPKPFRYDILGEAVNGPIPDFEPMSDHLFDELEREEDGRLADGSF